MLTNNGPNSFRSQALTVLLKVHCYSLYEYTVYETLYSSGGKRRGLGLSENQSLPLIIISG